MGLGGTDWRRGVPATARIDAALVTGKPASSSEETSFLASKPSAAPFGFCPFFAVGGGRTCAHSKPGCAASFFGRGHAQVPSFTLRFVEPLDGLVRSLVIGELDERKAPRPTGRPVGGEKHLHDFTHGGEESL
jgi:hypothetical protein